MLRVSILKFHVVILVVFGGLHTIISTCQKVPSFVLLFRLLINGSSMASGRNLRVAHDRNQKSETQKGLMFLFSGAFVTNFQH